jgi:hypothetical protein
MSTQSSPLTLAAVIEQMATGTGTISFVDGVLTMQGGVIFNLGEVMRPAHILIQEGGSRTELYLHSWPSAGEAEEDRYSCKDDGSYRTSPTIEIPPILAALGESFYAVAEEIIGLIPEIGFPEDREDIDDEATLAATD